MWYVVAFALGALVAGTISAFFICGCKLAAKADRTFEKHFRKNSCTARLQPDANEEDT